MRNRRHDSKVVELDDLESRRWWAALILFASLMVACYSAGLLLQQMDKSLDQVSELSERVERLQHPPAPAPSTSEPAKT